MPKSVQISQPLRAWMDVFMHRSMRSLNHYAKSTGLSMPQFSIMMQLHYRGVCGISDISDRFEITNAAASQLAEKLVHSGYLERTEDPSDRRAKLLKLSPKGKDLIEEGIDERYRWMDDLANNLTAEEKVKVSEALNTLTEAAQHLEDKNNIRKTSRLPT